MTTLWIGGRTVAFDYFYVYFFKLLGSDIQQISWISGGYTVNSSLPDIVAKRVGACRMLMRERRMLLTEGTTPLQQDPTLKPEDIKLQLEMMQGCLEGALRKVFKQQETLQKQVKPISENLQGKRRLENDRQGGDNFKEGKANLSKLQ
ncbi:unnamed protein product [Caenorhabditis brenneri]